MKSSTNKILTIAVVLLLLTNIALVVYMLSGKKHGPGKPPSRPSTSEMLARELNMTEAQKTQHQQLREDHLKNIRPLFDSIRMAKTALYNLLKDSTASDSLVNVYTRQISDKQVAIEKMTFAHFQRVRQLFTPDQQPRFDEFVQKMMQRGRKDSAQKKVSR